MSKRSTERIEEEAAEWLVRRDGADWSAADASRLQQWLDDSIAHSVAFIRLETAWEQSLRLKALGSGEAGVVPPPGRWRVSPFFGRAHAGSSEKTQRVRWLALAASVLLSLTVGSYFAADWLKGDRYTTAVGMVSAVPMSDGSRVTLNTASEIRVAVSQTERKVELRKGEAFFDVAKDPNRPFVVEAGSKRIVAIGTQFSVRKDGDEIEISVTEGEVRVESAGSSGAKETRLASARLQSLTAGKVARGDDEGLLVEKRPLADLQEHLAWRGGYLVFNETPLADAVAEFNRYSAERIVIEDPKVAAYKVSGKFRSTSLDAFVRLLESAFPIEVQREDARIRLSGRE